MLGRGHFVMLRLGRNTQLPQFFIQFCHKSFHSWLDGAKIMVFHLLSFRGLSAKQSPAGKYQVLPFLPHGLIYQKVFLFRSHIGDNFFCMDIQNGKQPFRCFA